VIVATLFGLTPKSALAVSPLGEAWHDFYLMAGTAAVTLVGLLFVALSLHVEILFRTEHRDFRVLAAEAFQGYLYVLITSLLFLLPAEDPHFTAIVFALLNLVMLVRTAFRAPSFVSAHKAKGGPMNQRWRFFVPALAYILALTAIIQWLAGNPSAGFGLFSPVAMMLAASTRTSWDLLEYVGRARGGA
jgi:hypothetical protein